MLPELPVRRLHLRWHAARPCPLPLGLGEALRGALGYRAAEDPAAFAIFYQHQGTAPWCWRYAPRRERACTVAVHICLIGHAVQFAETLTKAAVSLPALDITRSKLRLPPLTLIEATAGPTEPLPAAAEQAIAAAGWALLTPMVVTRQHAVLTEGWQGADIGRAVIRRLSSLAEACGLSWSPPCGELVADCSGLTATRFPAKGATHPACQGTISAAGCSAELRQLLAAACLVNAGRFAVFGAGTWVPINDAGADGAAAVAPCSPAAAARPPSAEDAARHQPDEDRQGDPDSAAQQERRQPGDEAAREDR
ncbi:MAG: hypothetical protein N3B15_01360 [Planctomycetota bacterium]|nr:hypothetical protein [Planctomycetota bacterium]MCX8039213.1 hypothetical protein [Planctomycetota bacterium]